MGKILSVVAREQCIGCFSCMFACSRQWHGALTQNKAALNVRGYLGDDGAFSIRTCRACADPDCVAACPTGALTQKKGGALKLDVEACNSCRACVEACLIGALRWDAERSLPLPCSHCGACVKYCPNDVLAMRKRREAVHVDENS